MGVLPRGGVYWWQYLQYQSWSCQYLSIMALRYSPTQWVRLGLVQVDTYRVVGRTREEIVQSRVGRSSSRDYGDFSRDTHHYNRMNQKMKKPTTSTKSNYAQFIKNQNFASRRAMYHRTGPVLSRFTTTSSQYGHY